MHLVEEELLVEEEGMSLLFVCFADAFGTGGFAMLKLKQEQTAMLLSFHLLVRI
jgi:hypothetical protein